MPRSNSSFDVAPRRQRGQRGAGAGPGAARWRCGCSGRRQGGATGIARTAEIERLARTAPARRAGRSFARHRHLAAAERARRARGVGILARVEGIAAAAAAGRRGRRFLHDRRGRGNLRLLVIAGLGLRIALLLPRPLLRIALLRIALLPLRRARLNGSRRRGHVGLRHRRLAARRGRRGAKLAQPLFELPVAVLQLLVLAGQLPELVFQPLDPHFQIGVVGLHLALRGALRRTLPRERDLCGRGLHRQDQHRGNRRGTGSIEKSG